MPRRCGSTDDVGAGWTWQVDREDNWDDYIILQAYIMTAVHALPFLYCSNGTCHRYADFP